MNEFPIESRHSAEEKKKTLKAAQPILLKSLRENELGATLSIKTPFGIKPLIYADYTASARALTFIEDYIQSEVLPSYANTHSESSACATQTHYLREEARGIIKRCVNAGENDACIFAGSGYTTAINLLIRAMKVKELASGEIKSTKGIGKNYCYANRWGSIDCVLCNMPFSNKGQYQEHEKSKIHIERVEAEESKETNAEGSAVVVFISQFEHHSNILPWRESGAVIELIPVSDKTGDLDYGVLEEKLKVHSKARMKIGSFLGCSNITGVCTNVDLIAYLLHLHNGIALFDMTACAPYLKLDMNLPVYSFETTKAMYPDVDDKRYNELCYKDAMMFSGHKFIGGPGSTGVLIAKRNLFTGTAPATPGGGTVLFVNEKEHMYVASLEQREEGGTPPIIGSIRTGLAIQLKEAIGEDFIEKREVELINYARAELHKMPNIVLLESPYCRDGLKKLPIFSFNVKSHGKFLHFNFVVKLLNDLFGIQSRGGCACAAVYGLHLLGINTELSHQYNQAVGKGYEILRPGFVRINFAFWAEEPTVQYILAAISWIGKYGWMLLPYYTFDVEKCEWNIRSGEEEVKRTWLHKIDYSKGYMAYPKGIGKFIHDKPINLNIEKALHEADNALKNAIQEYKHIYGKAKLDQEALFADSEVKSLRWFLLPSEILDQMRAVADGKGAIEDFLECSELKLPFKGGVGNVQKVEKVNVLPAEPEEDVDFAFPGVALEPTPKKPSKKFVDVPGKVLKLVGEAIKDFDMIHNGDRILVCVSGGKDSLSLLHVLLNLQARAPVKFDIGAVTVDPQTPQYNPEPLAQYMKKLEVPYYLESQDIVGKAMKCMQKDSICAFCSRMRRGAIYYCARKNKYNVVALGQHLDDLAESFMMSVLHNGKLRTMKANYMNDKGDVRVIRPLVYCREKFFKEITEEAKLPVIVDNCPACFAAPKERHRIKLMLAQQEHVFPTIFSSLLQSMKPLMTKTEPDVEDEDD